MDPFFFPPPSLPKPCRCGNTRESSCSETGLRNHWNFPPFAYLPEQNDIDETYYGNNEGDYSWSPVRHWGLVGEIVDTVHFIRHRARIETHFGETVQVNFHIDDDADPTYFQWSDLEIKSTLCILYPVRRTFLDMNEGLRQESATSVMVFPVTLEALTQDIQAHVRARLSQTQCCFFCGSPPAEGQKLKACNRCKIAVYCDQDRCQRPHWKQSHRKLCDHAVTLDKLAGLDFSNFENFTDWSFISTPRPSQAQIQARAQHVIREHLYRMGASPSEAHFRLDLLLKSIASKKLQEDPISSRIFKAQGGLGDVRKHVSGPSDTVAECFLFQFLDKFCRALVEDPRKRYHVVDLRTEDPLEEMANIWIFNTLAMSIPQWQHEECIGGISWAMETHDVMNQEDLYPKDIWRVKADDGAIEAMMASNRISGMHAFTADLISIVAEVGLDMAQKNPECTVVRVLRATGNKAYSDAFRNIATKTTPDNLYTLWIREDVSICGSFKPPRSDLSLVDQLLDASSWEESFIERMMNRKCMFAEEKTNSGDDRPSRVVNSAGKNKAKRGCAACNEAKAAQ